MMKADVSRTMSGVTILCMLGLIPAVSHSQVTANSGIKHAGVPESRLASPPEKAENQKTTPPDIDDYVLGPDDVFDLAVSNHADLNRTLVVPPDGKITLPDIGDFLVLGKSRQTLAREIQTAYDKTLNNATVTIIAREIHSHKVGVTGGVRAPLYYDLKRNWRLMDLITAAGGLTSKPNRIRGRILRHLQTIPVDVERAHSRPDDTDANLKLEAGDIVILDELVPLRDEVHVLGQVNRVGNYQLDEQTTLITLITAAGGVTDHAALTKAYVMRDKKQIFINLRPALAQNKTDDTVLKFKLEPGDVLHIPEIEDRYAVMGQVGRPNYYPIPEKGPVNVFEALNLAGGQLPSGDLSKAGIISMIDGKPSVVKVNLNDVLKHPEIATDITMKPDDVLFVPPRGPRGFVWQDALTPLSVLSLFGLRLFR